MSPHGILYQRTHGAEHAERAVIHGRANRVSDYLRRFLSLMPRVVEEPGSRRPNRRDRAVIGTIVARCEMRDKEPRRPLIIRVRWETRHHVRDRIR